MVRNASGTKDNALDHSATKAPRNVDVFLLNTVLALSIPADKR